MRAELRTAIAVIAAVTARQVSAQTAPTSAQSGSSSAASAPYACGDDAERHRFDFWLGAWNVTTEGGTKVGESVIETASNGCAILENWAGARGGRGKSLNSYNPEQKEWQQFWIGSGGGGNEDPSRQKDGQRTNFFMKRETSPQKNA